MLMAANWSRYTKSQLSQSKWVLAKLKPQGLKGLEITACVSMGQNSKVLPAQMLCREAHARNLKSWSLDPYEFTAKF